MCEALTALFVVLATVFLIEMIREWVRSLLRSELKCSGVFIVIPLRKDSENIEMTIREVLFKSAEIVPNMKICVWNIDGECEALTICQKLREDIGGFDIVDNISSDIL